MQRHISFTRASSLWPGIALTPSRQPTTSSAIHLFTGCAMPCLCPRWLHLASLSWKIPPSVAPSLRRPFSASAVLTAATLKNSPLPAAAPQIQLRDYQEECIQSVLASVGLGHKRIGISLATGAGKTVIFTQLIARVPPRLKRADRTLILAHRRELVEQAARHCSNAYPTKTVEVEMGNIHSSGSADITIASIQSITSGDRIDKFDPRQFKLVLVDEAHHIVAPMYLRTLEHFGLEEKRDDSPILIGVSATFSRFDGLKLGAAIDVIAYHKDYIDMIGDKWLSDVIFTTVESTANLTAVRSGANGDFRTGELSEVVNTDHVNEITVRSWFAKAEGRKSTLVFCVDLAHVTGLCQTFRKHNVDARFVTGDTPKLERSERLDAFKRGDFPVLINCGVFTEGTDIPNIDCVVLGRPTRSRNLLVQMIGRGMRLHSRKTNCHIIDMVSSLSTGVVSTPTLFGLNPSELVNNASVNDLKSLKERREAEQGRKAQVLAETPIAPGAYPTMKATDVLATGDITFTEYESVFDLIGDTASEKHIRAISQHAWVQAAPEKYILSGLDGSYIRLERADEKEPSEVKYVVWEVVALPKKVAAKAPYAKPRRLCEASTFIDAVHGADSYAAETYPRWLISKSQSWRRGPPTEGQLKFLNTLRTEDNKLEPTDITKGKAADMITKFRHGARGAFSNIKSKQQKAERKQLTVEKRRSREQVTVGPLIA